MLRRLHEFKVFVASRGALLALLALLQITGLIPLQMGGAWPLAVVLLMPIWTVFGIAAVRIALEKERAGEPVFQVLFGFCWIVAAIAFSPTLVFGDPRASMMVQIYGPPLLSYVLTPAYRTIAAGGILLGLIGVAGMIVRPHGRPLGRRVELPELGLKGRLDRPTFQIWFGFSWMLFEIAFFAVQIPGGTHLAAMPGITLLMIAFRLTSLLHGPIIFGGIWLGLFGVARLLNEPDHQAPGESPATRQFAGPKDDGAGFVPLDETPSE